MANIKQQFIWAVQSGEAYGESKYVKKRTVGQGDGEFFSYNDTNNVLDTATDFARFLKANFPEIKMARDINVTHVYKFLDSKSSTCKNLTVQQYAHRLYKLSLCLNKRFKLDLKWKIDVERINEPKTRDLRMDPDEFEKALSTATRMCESYKAVLLARDTGLRVDALSKLKVYNFDEVNGMLTVVKDKGGRTYTKQLRPYAIELLKEYTQNKGMTDYIFSNKNGGHIQAGSINKYLQERLKAAGITKYADAKTSIHSIRKLYAKEEYEKLISEGYTKKEALDKVSSELGHGKDRVDVLYTYIL